MNPFFLGRSEQLAIWKSLRDNLKNEDDQTAIKQVVEHWSQAPLLKMAYDPENSSSWISPWEMINANQWCPYSVAIGMEFTLRLGGWNPDRFTLMLIRDYDISDQRMILKIDDNKVLNYFVGEINEYPLTNHDVIKSYRNDGKKYFSLS